MYVCLFVFDVAHFSLTLREQLTDGTVRSLEL